MCRYLLSVGALGCLTASFLLSSPRAANGIVLGGIRNATRSVGIKVVDSGSVAPAGVAKHIVSSVDPSATMLNGVPTSSWTYGCTATSAGMIFGYYDRIGYANMYTGPTNGGVAPLSHLGQGDDPASPIASSCSIIATQKGFDGRATYGHVDDYWVSYGTAGADPWRTAGRGQHVWGGCVADYMGTNQWNWDSDLDGTTDTNSDGSTLYFYNEDNTKLYDFVPEAEYGLPQTEACHGMRLFAESRGYAVKENYTQVIDAVYSGGFSFANYMDEINCGCPVMIHVEGHSMVGVGYLASNQTVYLHDTWGDYIAEMTWGGWYSDPEMPQFAVSVLHLATIPEPSSVVLLEIGLSGLLIFARWRKSYALHDQ